MDNACLVYNLNVVIKAKDPPWFAGLKGSVADSVAANIDRLLGLSKPFAKKMIVTTAFFVFFMLNSSVNSNFLEKFLANTLFYSTFELSNPTLYSLS